MKCAQNSQNNEPCFTYYSMQEGVFDDKLNSMI